MTKQSNAARIAGWQVVCGSQVIDPFCQTKGEAEASARGCRDGSGGAKNPVILPIRVIRGWQVISGGRVILPFLRTRARAASAAEGFNAARRLGGKTESAHVVEVSVPDMSKPKISSSRKLRVALPFGHR